MKIQIKPFSINAAWKGQRYKTKEYKKWREEFCYKLISALPHKKNYKNLLEIKYNFHIKTFKKSDVDNFIKTTTDGLVDAKIIEDDRFVKKYVIEKFECKDEKEFIEIEIKEI